MMQQMVCHEIRIQDGRQDIAETLIQLGTLPKMIELFQIDVFRNSIISNTELLDKLALLLTCFLRLARVIKKTNNMGECIMEYLCVISNINDLDQVYEMYRSHLKTLLDNVAKLPVMSHIALKSNIGRTLSSLANVYPELGVDVHHLLQKLRGGNGYF
eukprot:gb/GECH01011494.1/.p1 GENE.gb/GECH01011494.1/~~gb/GECH01011494.1/.p1  ORF type:complete len:158 (+),score=38.64 gb/GECH01011494.1/:1-474(+)